MSYKPLIIPSINSNPRPSHWYDMVTVPPTLKFNLDLLAIAFLYSIILNIVSIVLFNPHVLYSAATYKMVEKHAWLQQ
jgi:hypothetical protein